MALIANKGVASLSQAWWQRVPLTIEGCPQCDIWGGVGVQHMRLCVPGTDVKTE